MNKGLFQTIYKRFSKNRIGEVLVKRGKLTPQQLRDVLSHQKHNGLTFGDSALALNFITKTDVRTSLMEQTAYRAVIAVVGIFIGLSATSMPAKASPFDARAQFSNKAKIYKASYGGMNSSKLEKQTAQPKLFGTSEVASTDISAFKKWTDILVRLESVSFKAEKLKPFENMGDSSKVVAINEYVNQFRYIEDKNNFGKTDYWATPTEFFVKGGDCEDFAIAKYAMLKALGIPEDKMRLAIVQDKIKKIPHAVLIVYTDNGPMLLDNQLKTTRQVASVDRYKPIYSINATGWWRHLS